MQWLEHLLTDLSCLPYLQYSREFVVVPYRRVLGSYLRDKALYGLLGFLRRLTPKLELSHPAFCILYLEIFPVPQLEINCYTMIGQISGVSRQKAIACFQSTRELLPHTGQRPLSLPCGANNTVIPKEIELEHNNNTNNYNNVINNNNNYYIQWSFERQRKTECFTIISGPCDNFTLCGEIKKGPTWESQDGLQPVL